MPIGRSAKKSLRKSVSNRRVNMGMSKKMKEAIKKFLKKPTAEGLRQAYSSLDKAKKARIIHKNKVAKIKSRLSKKVMGEVVVAKKEKKVVKKKTTLEMAKNE